MLILKREYDGESIIDAPQDIDEAFMEDYNEKIKMIPTDEYGIQQGIFTITVEWREE